MRGWTDGDTKNGTNGKKVVVVPRSEQGTKLCRIVYFPCWRLLCRQKDGKIDCDNLCFCVVYSQADETLALARVQVGPTIGEKNGQMPRRHGRKGK